MLLSVLCGVGVVFDIGVCCLMFVACCYLFVVCRLVVGEWRR